MCAPTRSFKQRNFNAVSTLLLDAVGYSPTLVHALQSVDARVRHHLSATVTNDAVAMHAPPDKMAVKIANRRRILGSDAPIPFSSIRPAPPNKNSKTPATQNNWGALVAQKRAAKRKIAAEPEKTDESCKAALDDLAKPYIPEA